MFQLCLKGFSAKVLRHVLTVLMFYTQHLIQLQEVVILSDLLQKMVIENMCYVVYIIQDFCETLINNKQQHFTVHYIASKTSTPYDCSHASNGFGLDVIIFSWRFVLSRLTVFITVVLNYAANLCLCALGGGLLSCLLVEDDFHPFL